MPYKYVKNIEEKIEQPVITETKVIEKKEPQTEEESQEQYNKEQEKEFFDDDEEIIEVVWD